jgi:hypothetical protein
VAPIYTIVSGVDEVITLPGGGGLRAWTGWRKDVDALARGSFDTAILFPNSYGAARIASKAAIPERWGYAADMRSGMLTRAIQAGGEMHQQMYYQALTRRSGSKWAAIRSTPMAVGEAVLRDVGLVSTSLCRLCAACGRGGGCPSVTRAGEPDHQRPGLERVMVRARSIDRRATTLRADCQPAPASTG